MTQMPYGAYPPQQYPPMQQPMAPYQSFPPQGQPQQGFPQQGQQPPAAPLVAGSIDDFYNQPTAAGGPGISWKDKALGTTYRGVISGKCSVQQDSDYTTKQLKFQRDGVTPKWVMLIPLSGIQTNHPGQAEFPDGEVIFYVRGQAKDELTRAMAEAGCSGEPAEGATFQVTLTQRKPNRQGNPSNIVQIVYTPPNGVAHQAAPAQQVQAPVQEQAAPQPQAPAGLPPVQQAAPLAPLGGQAQQAPAPLPPMAQPQAQQAEAPPQWAQPAQAQAPQAQALAPQPPAGLDPNQQALLASLGAAQGQVQG